MAEAPKMDLTAKLSDKVLMEIFDRLPSLSDKLRLESVSHRFQRCLIELLNTRPIPLEYFHGKLNGYKVPQDLLTAAVRTLANKAKFSRISLCDGSKPRLNLFLPALASLDIDRLDKVISFKVIPGGRRVGGPFLKEILTKCTEMSDVRLDEQRFHMKNLAPALEGKQAVHPELKVGFGPDGDKLTLTLGKVSFQRGRIRACQNPDCIDCGRFYPTLIRSLKERADQGVDVHLANGGRLDRCRIDSIVADLNKAVSRVGFDGDRLWTALHAEMNEAYNRATITFESSTVEIGQFQITLDCGQCLNIGCFGCL